MPKATCLVLGLDPGFANFGWVVCDLLAPKSGALHAGGVITTAKAKTKVLACDDEFRRMQEIGTELHRLIAQYKIVGICAESMSQPRNASAAKKVAYSWGIIATLALFAQSNALPADFSSPQAVKKALTGKISSSKEEVQECVRMFYPQLPRVLAPWNAGRHEHIVDALAAVETARGRQVFRALASARA